MLDVLIAGAGPAGSVAAWVLARSGARVLIVDRDEFPRPKLCGDTLNPGAIALLEAEGLADGPWRRGLALTGMLVSGPSASVRARYPAGVVGRSIVRQELDAWLLERAVGAGARFEPGWTVRAPLVQQEPRRPDGPDGQGAQAARLRPQAPGAVRQAVRGVAMARRGHATSLRVPASLTIAADGRRSTLARALGLSRHPQSPRRWAFGTYASGVTGVTDVGEMHVRRGHYIGVAPIGPDLANVCVVTGPRPAGPTPLDIVRRAIGADRLLAARFARATFPSDVRVLGPLAVDATAAGVDGLLLAGDAGGFVDPMTGDGLRLAMLGGALAAYEAMATLERGDLAGAPRRLADARQAAFGAKVRFNRVLRATVNSPAMMTVAALVASVVPSTIDRVVRYAGDTP